ncbi:MAG: MBL fold metallo-hydrolase [Anaerolineales bacterium]
MARINLPQPWTGLFCRILFLAGLTLAAGCASPSTQPASTPVDGSSPTIGAETDFAHIDLGEGLYLRQIREDAFVVTHAFPWPANSLIVEMSNSDLVLVGTPYTPEAMGEVLVWMKAHFGERNIVAIDPGYHVDNLGGNDALIKQGIPVYGSDLTAELLTERGEQTRQTLLEMLSAPGNERYYKAHAEIPYVAPDRLFPVSRGLKLSFGEEQLEVYYPGPTQAPDKVAVYFPAKKILFGSCMILGGDQAGNIREADLENWPEAIKTLKRFDVDFVIPGHGDRVDPGLIDHTIVLLTTG